MRIMTRRAAGLDPAGWDDEARAEAAAYFDALAPDWHTRTSPARDAVVADALERGVVDATEGTCVELGSGIGAYTPMLAARWPTVLAVEVSLEMLRLAPPDARAPGPRRRCPAPARRTGSSRPSCSSTASSSQPRSTGCWRRMACWCG